MEDKISIIVPVYNAEKYLNKCVDSILNQTHKNIELILVNDGSKDNSLALCYKLAKKDDRIVVIDKENGGAASARNRGLDVATGNYIGFCDSDDWYDLSMLSTMLRIMQDNDLETLECTSSAYDDDGQKLSSDNDDKSLRILSPKEAIGELFTWKGSASLCTRLTKAEIIKDIRIPEGRRVEDFYFNILILLKVKKNVIYNYPFYNVRCHTGSVTSKATASIYLDGLYFFNKAKEELEKRNIDLKEEENYFYYKMTYLFMISLTKDEMKRYSLKIKEMKRDIRKNKKAIKSDKLLRNKEKKVLLLCGFSVRIVKLFFSIKHLGD